MTLKTGVVRKTGMDFKSNCSRNEKEGLDFMGRPGLQKQ